MLVGGGGGELCGIYSACQWVIFLVYVYKFPYMLVLPSAQSTLYQNKTQSNLGVCVFALHTHVCAAIHCVCVCLCTYMGVCVCVCMSMQ